MTEDITEAAGRWVTMPGDETRGLPGQAHEEASGDAASDGVLAVDAPAEGLSWSWGLDFETLLTALSEPAPWNRPANLAQGPTTVPDCPGDATRSADPVLTDPVRADAAVTDSDVVDAAEAELAELLEAIDTGRSRVVPLGVVAGRIAESLPTGPDLAGWLATSSAAGLEDGALAGVAASYRRLASWAQAGELAAVAQMASRSAAADGKIGVDDQGRPARMPEEACAQVSLALTMSQSSASWWSDLGITLTWRLAATGAALRAGQIDLSRARLIAEATGSLDDDTARVVEARVLPAAGEQTTAQLRVALRRAVIAADPQGTERRREEAERRAKVVLYPDAEGTASLAGYSLPSIRAAAAMARISALARALKASGASGGIDLLRAQVFLGLLLGTLPYIPPAPDGPPDQPPDQPPDEPPDGPPDEPHDDGLPDEPPHSRDPLAGDPRRGAPPPAWPEVMPFLPAGPAALGDLRPLGGGLLDLRLPWTTLAGESAEPGYLSRIGPVSPAQARHLADLAACDATALWQVVVTSTDGRALAVTRVHRERVRAGPGRPPSDGPGSSAGLVRRVTVTVSQDTLGRAPPEAAPPILAQVLRAAGTAADRAVGLAATSECAHTEASSAYRPPPRLWEYITARDLTCRFPTCRQPASRCDLDHTTPYDKGGKTCHCNLGGLCRFHHKLKQHLRWLLTQPVPGTFVWTTPVGRTYITQPDAHAI